LESQDNNLPIEVVQNLYFTVIVHFMPSNY
jgi:hypothetical protein